MIAIVLLLCMIAGAVGQVERALSVISTDPGSGGAGDGAAEESEVTPSDQASLQLGDDVKLSDAVNGVPTSGSQGVPRPVLAMAASPKYRADFTAAARVEVHTNITEHDMVYPDDHNGEVDPELLSTTERLWPWRPYCGRTMYRSGIMMSPAYLFYSSWRSRRCSLRRYNRYGGCSCR